MRSTSVGLLLGSLLVAGVACGEADDPAPPSPAEPRVAELAEAVCGLMFNCCVRGELDYFVGPFVTAENCAARLVEATRQAPGVDLNQVLRVEDALGIRFPLPNLAALERATAERRGRLDGGAVEDCVEFLAGVPCNEAPTEDPEAPTCSVEFVPAPPATPCDVGKLFVGQAGEGEPCSSPDAELPPCGPAQSADDGTCRSGITQSLECAPGLVCRRSSVLGVAGECVLPGQIDEPCQQDQDCAADLYCSLLYGTCQPYRRLGDGCAYSDEDNLNPHPDTYLVKCHPALHCDTLTDTCVPPCERGAQCVANLDEQCDSETNLVCASGRCDFMRTDGLPCAEDADCVAGLWCGPDPDQADLTQLICQPLLDDDWPCPRHAACASGFCNPNAYPIRDRCQPPPHEPGEHCYSQQDEECRLGYCEIARWCADDFDCPPGISCQVSAGTCAPYCLPLRAIDQSCSEDRHCQSEACVGGTCQVAPVDLGEPCDPGEDDECESGFCNPATDLGDPSDDTDDVVPVCAELPLPLGAFCVDDAHCESLVCYDDPDDGEVTCQRGLDVGDECNAPQTPPCNPKVAYCDLWDAPSPVCAPLRDAGAECEVGQQCRGQCEIHHGRWMCTDEPPEGEAICDGAE